MNRRSPPTLLIGHGFEANYLLGFARGLHAQGIPLLVTADDTSAPLLAAAGLPHVNLRGSVEPRRSRWAKLSNLLRYHLSLAVLVVRHRGGAIHFCGILRRELILLEGLLLPLWLRLWAGTYVHTAHNALPHGCADRRLFRLAYRWIYRWPHAILTHAAVVSRQLEQEFGVNPARLHRISIGLNEEVPASGLDAAGARARLGLPPTGRLLLFCGKIEPYKGLDLLLAAWAQVNAPDARLCIVGASRDPDQTAALTRQIAALPPERRPLWRDAFVPNAELGLWLEAADALVLPYRQIYQSGVVLLGLRFGLPLIATPVGSMPDYVNPATGILADAADVPALTRALHAFFDRDPPLSRAAIAAAAQEFAWPRQCARIRALYPSSPATADLPSPVCA
jgi:glycosyltransferase involved in cell wall biosynthesis